MINKTIRPIPLPDSIRMHKRKSLTVGEVQEALLELKHTIDQGERLRKEKGNSTTEAIRTFQRQAGLKADGEITEETASRLNEERTHVFVASNKTRTERLQHLLQTAGYEIDSSERTERRFGASRRKRWPDFKRRINWNRADESMSRRSPYCARKRSMPR